jgi:hypothetical protein
MEDPDNSELDKEIDVLDDMLSGLDDVVKQVKDLNDNVYTKNYLDKTKMRLDKTRNVLLFGFTISFLIVSVLLGIIISHQNSGDERRAVEAAQGRRQIADCTVKPGVILDDGYVNPGKCYTEGVTRTAQAIDRLISNTQEGVRQLLLIQAEAVAANQTLSEDVRSFARQQVIALRSFTPKTDKGVP